MNKKRKPHSVKQPSSRKKPRGKEKPESAETETIVWHLGIIDRFGSWGWNDIKNTILWDGVLKKLRHFETMTWAAIKESRRNHSIPVSELCHDAQKRLCKLKQDDIEELFSVGLSGKQRIFGIRDRRVLKILWWDPNHTVCPSMKKYT